MTPTPYLLRLHATPSVEKSGTAHPVDLPAGKPLALLSYLVLAADAPTRDELVRMFWPGASEKRGRASLRQALWYLRKVLDEDVVVAEGDELHVPEGIARTDVEELEACLAAGDLERAHELWAGGPFVSFSISDAPAFNRWADELRTDLERRLGAALVDRAVALSEAGDPEAALRWFARARDVQPYLEEPVEGHVRSLVDLRRLSEAEAVLAAGRATAEASGGSALFAELERLIREARRRPTEREEGPPPTEFVGRSRDFAELLGRWRTAADGRAQLAGILGPAGVGKSRLAREALRSAELEGAATLTVRCVPGEEGVAWGVAAELVGELHGRPGAAGISASSQRLIETLRPSLALPDRSPDAPPGDRSLAPAALTDALADLVAAVAHETPLVILIDDLQWADPESATLLTRLGRSLRNAAVLLLVTCRSDPASGQACSRLEALGDAGAAHVVRLDPLTPAEVTELIVLLADLPPEQEPGPLAARLHQASGGSPLLLVEILNALWQEGLLVRADEDRWTFDAVLFGNGGVLPDTLAKAVLGRLGQLDTMSRRVAAVLAAAPRPVSVNSLYDRIPHVEPARIDAAVEHLAQKALVERDEAGCVGVAHDLVRDAIREALRDDLDISLLPGTSQASPRRRLLLAAAAAILALVSGSFAVAHYLPASAPPMPLYGGGDLLVDRQAETLVVAPPVGDEDWRVVRRMPVNQEGGGGVKSFMLPDGMIRRFQYAGDLDGPAYIAEVLEDGTQRPFLRHESDIGLAVVAPDGLHAVVNRADETGGFYRQDLYRLHLRDKSLVRLDSLPSRPALLPDWSPDGAWILSGTNVRHDSIVIFRPDGRDRFAVAGPNPDLLDGSWCGGSDRAIIASYGADGRQEVHLLNRLDRSLTGLDHSGLRFNGWVECAPDGRHFLASAVVGRESRVVLAEVDGNGHQVLPGTIFTGNSRVRWEPPRKPVPVNVRVDERAVRMTWGERRSVSATVSLSDGTHDGSTSWSSRNPSVASVDPQGHVTANGRGNAWLIAEANGWLRDSVRVEVSGTPTGRVLLVDSFIDLRSDRWFLVGQPHPVPVTTADGPALDLRGDNVHSDGIASRKTFDLSLGATLELQARVPLTGIRHGQSIGICLLDADLPHEEPAQMFSFQVRQSICFSHPQGEFFDFNASSYGFGNRVAARGTGTTPLLPMSDWTAVAIQMRPDGIASLFLDAQHVRTLEVPVDNGPDTRWRAVLTNRALDTRIMVRDLVLWGEERYPVPSDR